MLKIAYSVTILQVKGNVESQYIVPEIEKSSPQ